MATTRFFIAAGQMFRRLSFTIRQRVSVSLPPLAPASGARGAKPDTANRIVYQGTSSPELARDARRGYADEKPDGRGP